jgi:hypothetical protein
MTTSVTRARRNGLIWIALCGSISIFMGFFLGNDVPGGVIGFQGVYYGTRCLIQHCDPYQESELLHLYQTETGRSLTESLQRRKAVTLYVNLPGTFLVVAPFAVLPWGPAHILWIVLIAGLFVLAAFLMWDTGAKFAPGVALWLTCILLVDSELIFATGNTAGLVVSLGVIATWCFLTEQYVPAGIVCLAVSLAIKPHDTGLIWLYFLLAGGVHRKRALQTLGVTVALNLLAIFWLSQVAPHWLRELRSNLTAISAAGGLNDPGLSSLTGRGSSLVIDLQSVISALWNDPMTYNLLSYLICGALLLVMALKTLRTRYSRTAALIALAFIAALSMLPTYHRPYDAKLLLLLIPACAALWAEGGSIARFALLLSTTAIVATGDIPLAVLSMCTRNLNLGAWGLPGQMLMILITRPVALILLAVSAFYLWVYVRRSPQTEMSRPLSSNKAPDVPAPA